ncbi:ABC-F family ATP-binding cassette domain-containing protein [Pectinatus haikarae]|uniref:ATP-binding cassette subfamily F protein uup n=1 Tax=Pectinatus haikarae TaxID=349096 RepID=A0ABT9Y6Y6_9FIRM|nr:ABC-F family ATP-binding cassette domain-containing protein [Pectinatus haikarae]MDQ0203586.1 ATP-binding cassette subfamily F protein uup [Pectinatus haikarae]
MILTAENLAKSYGEKILFENVSFSVDTGDKIGIVGINGTGKSTLMRTIAKLVQTDSGNFITMKNIRIEYLDQDKNLNLENTVLTEAFHGSQDIMKALREYEMTLCAPESTSEETQQKLVRFSEKIDELDGWQLESDAKAILTKLGITDFSKKAGELSGGQQKRLALAAALIQPCDLLLLDEPTNHLDMETIEWLETYLSGLKCAVILITHDRYFLDSSVSKILELDRGSAYIYTGNYSDFLEQKIARTERENASEQKRQNFLRNELKWIRRGAQARSTKQKARLQHFEQVNAQETVSQNDKVQIALGTSRLGRKIIELDNISYQRNGNIILKNFSYTILRSDRVGILGPNGSGKSTLLNLISGKLTPQTGSIKIGQTVKIGYFTQKNTEMDEDLRAIEYIKQAANYITLIDNTRITASQLMELFLFDGNLQWTPIARLSGGEKRRLYLLRILMTAPNVLLLDEPTNDLDLQTMAILESFIDKFNGAIIFVSHDRFFVDRLADKVFAYEEDGSLRQYAGGYSYYSRIKLQEDEKKEMKLEPENKTAFVKKEKPVLVQKKFTYKEKCEYEQIENIIAQTEIELKAVEKQMQANAADYAQIRELNIQLDGLKDKLDKLLARWAYLEEIAENS